MTGLLGAVLFLWGIQALALDPHRPLQEFGHVGWIDGLPQNSAHSVVQTPEGYMWVGTYEGLIRFDGARFTVFDAPNTPELKSNPINWLCATQRGTGMLLLKAWTMHRTPKFPDIFRRIRMAAKTSGG